MKIRVSILILLLSYSNTPFADIDVSATDKEIRSQRNNWFEYLRDRVLVSYPQPGSVAAEWDRQASNEYQMISGERYKLADKDQDQSSDYIYSSFANIALGSLSKTVDLRSLDSFNEIESLYDTATHSYDANKKQTRSLDFILKDKFQRGRPYQVLNKQGNYIQDYLSVKGSSFPSGHTWSGFKQAVSLSILLPERGGEIFSRALQFGESRVIVGAHFPTDTIASRIGNYFSLAQLMADDNIAATLANLARTARREMKNACEGNVRECVSRQPETPLYLNNSIGYYGKKETTAASAILPNEIPDKAAYLLRLRFPYLTESGWRDILAGTAYPRNSLAGWAIAPGNRDSFWGIIDLPAAYNGPAYLYDTLVVNQTATPVYDIAGFSARDEWKNTINGPGRLIKNGEGSLTLAGDDRFGGVEVNQGILTLSGNARYSDTSVVNGGTLAVNGTLNSAVAVNDGGVLVADGAVNAVSEINRGGLLAGNGRLGRVAVNHGGAVAPGHSIGKLNVDDNITFEPGSQYLVEVAENGRSDQIKSAGTAVLKGGTVSVSRENSGNLLSQTEVRSLLGQQYTILSAQQGVSGRFDASAPNYLFLGTRLSYQPDRVILTIGRNATDFARLGQTPNTRAVAAAADLLPVSSPLHESLLQTESADVARQAFRQLSGQIHADIASALIDDSRYLRETVNDRLRQTEGLAGASDIKADDNGAWAQLLGAWGHASDDGNAAGYQTSTYGVLLGLDTPVAGGRRLGVATGYTRTSLDGNDSASADSDNYHLAVYGGQQSGALALRVGGGYTWHRINTSRSVRYGMQSDHETAKYSAQTGQVFAETGYSVKTTPVNLEPFANLAYVHFHNNGMTEEGGAAALSSDKQNTEATVSTVGLRAETRWSAGKTATAGFRGELGWMHQLGSPDRDTALYFNTGQSPFVVSSVPASRDGMVVKASADVMMNKNARVWLGYSGLVSQNRQDNSVNAGLSWQF